MKDNPTRQQEANSKGSPSHTSPYPSHPVPMVSGLEIKKIEDLGLSPTRIALHGERIKKALDGSVVTTLPILGVCSTNNGAILSWKRLVRFLESDWSGQGKSFLESVQRYWSAQHLVTCIPAAGAASRYLAEVRRYVSAVEKILLDVHQSASQSAPQSLDEDFPPLASPYRRTLRARLHLLEVPAELQLLLEEQKRLFPQTIVRSAKILKELALHLTADHGLAGGLSQEVAARAGATVASENSSELLDLEAKDSSADWGVRRHWPSPEQSKKQAARFKKMYPLQAQNSSPLVLTGSSVKERETGHKDFFSALGLDGLLLHNERLSIEVFAAALAVLETYEGIPKAMVPTTVENDNFLFLKLVEQMSLVPCRANVMISPAGMQGLFSAEIQGQGGKLRNEVKNIFETARTPFGPEWLRSYDQRNGLKPGVPSVTKDTQGKRGEWLVLEQGNNLSTLRFDAAGHPYLNSQGQYSRVSGGHGELVNVFGEILSHFPEAECLHIRNIDNIIGAGPERRREIQIPARLFRTVRDCLEALRVVFARLLSEGEQGHEVPEVITDHDASGALATLASLSQANLEDSFGSGGVFSAHVAKQISVTEIISTLGNLFHWPTIPGILSLSQLEKLTAVHELLSRPLSIFGVVRKETGDVGGGPVFAQLPSGETVKICMEMPHASAQERDSYFGARGKVTHFNPVLVFFELQTHKQDAPTGRPVPFSKLFDDRFWLLASKEYEGQKVCYHETVLYELIGNSATSNLLFAELPRTLFNPHKNVADSLGQDRRSYGFDETLKTQDERNTPSP